MLQARCNDCEQIAFAAWGCLTKQLQGLPLLLLCNISWALVLLSGEKGMIVEQAGVPIG